MAVIDKQKATLKRRDEVPNQELARYIVENRDEKSVQQLVAHLSHNNRNIHSDCIKVLYEVGEKVPSLISPYIKEFTALLEHPNNRMIWGAMSALNAIAEENPAGVYRELPKIMAAADRGSVITRDMAVRILVKLTAVPRYADDAFPLLFDQLRTCPSNQLPMYAEIALPVISSNNRQAFMQIFTARVNDMPTEAKRRRLEKVIRKL